MAKLNNCLTCNKPVKDKWTWAHPKREKKYCSIPCSLKNARKSLQGKDSRVWFICTDCGKKFKTWKSNKTDRKNVYCSVKCRARGATPKGKDSYNWKGGVTPAINKRCNSAWWIELRKKVYKRDNYTCKTCDKTNCKVECHHIIPERLGGTHRMDNLVTLCVSCHKYAEWKIADGVIFKGSKGRTIGN